MRGNTLRYDHLDGHQMRSDAPEFGRLLRIRGPQGQPRFVGYIVAIKEADSAAKVIRAHVARPGTEVEDVGRVSGQLLRMLGLSFGQFVRTDRSNAI